MTTPAWAPPATDAVTPFSTRLRDSTREDHERAEGSPFMVAYLGGRVPIEGYAALQGQLWFVYEALEAGAAVLRHDPVVGPFLDPRLDRLPALAADLPGLLGDDWRTHLRAGDATAAHAARIRELADTWPAGFLAHHYIRYLGDLSGGRALGVKARKLYGLDDDGVRFYAFDAIPSARDFKDHYRGLLDTAAWSREEQGRIIDEARRGFRMTGAMFEELDRLSSAAFGG